MDRPDPHNPPAETEWLLTDGLGGFAMGTASGVLTRRYHGLLVVARRPPVERVVLVSQVVEKLVIRSDEQWLTEMRFVGREPLAAPASDGFEVGPQRAVWRSERAGVRVEKILERAHGRGAARVTYRVLSDRPGLLELRPLLALRDFHDLRTTGSEPVEIVADHREIAARSGPIAVRLRAEGCQRIDEPEEWHDFLYAHERDRGQDCVERLIVPCRFVLAFGVGPVEASLVFSAGEDEKFVFGEREIPGVAYAAARVVDADGEARAAVARLAVAADRFVVRRGDGGGGVSVIAGYPWFADWGRDTMIALPGLLLETGRFEEALATLRVFGGALRNGLIPNRFDDYEGGAHYNTVDASLWFLHAAAAYREAALDHAGYRDHLQGSCLSIIGAYCAGTDYEIRMDADGLITAGTPETQLTWMDAQRDGVTFTPRSGKCVEINALWHHGLVRTAEAITDEEPETAAELRRLAARTAASFAERFTNPAGGLFDRLEPDGARWKPIDEVRPNQVFAASLSRSPADRATRASVLEVLREHLLTPVGLRTLAPSDPRYIGTYRGSLFQRDAAYHNGTVWPWLLGAYVEGVLRLQDTPRGGKTPARAEDIRDLLRPLTARLDAWCLGQVSEVCEGDAPHRPDGCPAQAWSVAELLRAWMMTAAGP